MKRNPPTGLNGLDLEIREAVEAVARRQGLSLEAWLAAGEGEPARRPAAKRTRRPADTLDAALDRIAQAARRPANPDAQAVSVAGTRQTARQPVGPQAASLAASVGTERAAPGQAVRTAAALDSVARWIEQAEARLNDTARAAADRQDRLTAMVARTLSAVTERLDAVERRAEEPPPPALPPALADALVALRSECALLGRRLDAPSSLTSALDGIEEDLARLRALLGTLATQDEVAALEQRLRDLAEGVAQAAGREDLDALTGSLTGLRGQVETGMASLSGTVVILKDQIQSIATDLAEGLHGQIAREMEAVATRIDHVAANGAGREAVEALRRQIEEVRDALGHRAGADAVERLTHEVTALGRRIADMGAQLAGAADVAALRNGVEDIRAALKRSEDASEAAAVPGQLQSLSRRLDLLMSRPEPLGFERLGEQIAGLATEAARPVEDLSGRMDRRFGDLADDLKSLAAAGARSAEEVIARFENRLADLDGSLGALAAENAKPLKALGTRIDQRFSNLDDRLQGLALEAGKPVQVLAERVDGRLCDLKEHLAALVRESAGPVEALNGRVGDLTNQVGTLTRTVAAWPEPLLERLDRLEESLPGPLLERLDRLETGLAHGPLAERLGGIEEALRDGSHADRLGQIDESLTRLGETLAQSPMGERLDRIEEGLRLVGERSDTAPLELMVRSLQERFEGVSPASAAMDGLEERLTGIVDRLGLTAAEPLHQALTETLGHVRGLRGEAAIIAERAAKAALRDMAVSNADDMEAVRQGFAELKALQTAAEKKTQATLKAVHNALETLVMRMPSGASIVPPPAPLSSPAADLPAIRLETAVRKLHAAALSQGGDAAVPETVEAEEVLPAPAEPEEILLDPATPRSAALVPVTSFTTPQDGEPASVRASFIAAARRAAQAAASEATARPVVEAEKTEAADEPPISNQTLIERIRQTFEGHRRPLLLSLAILVLAAGSIPVANRFRQPPGGETPLPAAVASAPKPLSVTQPPEATGSLLQPSSSQTSAFAPGKVPANGSEGVSLAAPGAGKPAEPVAPRLPVAPLPATKPVDVAGLGDLPAATPASLRQGVLAGDAASVFDLAARLAEARGMPRDAALAAKLFERAAQAGLVPAQFRLANMQEKGAGLPRDLALARSGYERAAQAGNVRAMHNLAVLFAEGVEGKPNYTSAARWFLEAAEHGVRDSQYNLAVLLGRGLGLPRDLAQSYKWFSLAALDGDEDAGRKRDEVAARLSAPDLETAKTLVAGWRPKPTNPAANDVAPPAQGWSAAPAGTPARRT